MRDMWEDYWQDEVNERDDHAKLDATAAGLVAEAQCQCRAIAVTPVSFQQVHAALGGQAQLTRDAGQLAQLEQQGLVSCACVPDTKGNLIFAVAWLCRKCRRPVAVAEQVHRATALYNHGLREWQKANGGQQQR